MKVAQVEQRRTIPVAVKDMQENRLAFNSVDEKSFLVRFLSVSDEKRKVSGKFLLQFRQKRNASAGKGAKQLNCAVGGNVTVGIVVCWFGSSRAGEKALDWFIFISISTSTNPLLDFAAHLRYRKRRHEADFQKTKIVEERQVV